MDAPETGESFDSVVTDYFRCDLAFGNLAMIKFLQVEELLIDFRGLGSRLRLFTGRRIDHSAIAKTVNIRV